MSGSTKIGKMLHLDQLEALTEFSISASERNVANWTVYSTCPRESFLSIEGDGIFSTIDFGDPNGLATTFTVSNTGDDTLHWNTSGVPSEVTVSPSSGVLAPGAQEVVQMSVVTASLPAGRYLHKPFFYNEASVGQGMPDDEFGNTYKTIDITVNGAMNDTPIITSLISPAGGQVAIDWDFTSSGSDPFVGFQIYATQTPTDPDTYRLVYTTDIHDRQAVISGFTPGATYSFDMRVYSNDGARPGPFSNKVTVQVAGNPPSFIPSALNDTGITWGGDYSSGNNTSCTGVEIGAQDCSHGRDATYNDDSDGHAGFSYTKLDSNGVPLTNQNADYATTPWACVRDNVTGLIWEVKTNDGGLHDKDDRYNWYNTDPATNGGADGYADDDGDVCYGYNSGDSATFCNTEAYVNRVNAAGWCGASDWRMPTRKELEGLVTYDRSSPAIDLDYFPNAVSSSVWSGSPYAGHASNAWYVSFNYGNSSYFYRGGNLYVRLVRGGQ
ncbi:MAG: DUF1566 domain-containing protein [Candidatus Electrothrix sp. AX5]|nr:DUF1566 domain-containing protein [Candidatus Electrothrix sp. AX5]